MLPHRATSMLDPFKHLVENVKEKDKARRRKHTVPDTVPASRLEAEIEPQRKLAANVREVAQQLAECLDKLRIAQRGIMRGVQEYLGYDIDGVDVSLLALVQASSSFFDSCDAIISKSGLSEVSANCDRVLRECETICSTVQNRDQAYKEWKHYEAKVSEIVDDPARHQAHYVQSEREREKLKRNRVKLEDAKQMAEDSRATCEEDLRFFVERRTVFARATLHSLLRTYVHLIGSFGGQAATVAQSFENEFSPGTSVELVGMRKGSELDGVIAVVKGFDESTGRYTLALETGEETKLLGEHLLPMEMGEVSNETGGASEEPLRSEIRVVPASGPCAGCEAEVLVDGLAGPVQEVLVGGERAEMLEGTEGRLRVRVPPNSQQGLLRVEVRTAGWRQCIAWADEAFRYYESLGFGACGANVSLSQAANAPPGVPPAVASRTTGLVQGVAITASPLPVIVPAVPAGRQSLDVASLVFPLRYYFEFEVLELMDSKSRRTVALGFAWPLCAESPQGGAETPGAGSTPATPKAALRWASSSRIPENASELPRSVVVGGDIPKVHLAGKEVRRVSGWRPILDVKAGAILGALLEVDVTTLRISIFQDSVCRFTTEAALPEGWTSAPHGVVDVCGTVRCVRLHQGAWPPETVAEVAAGEGEGPMEPGGAAGEDGNA